MGNMFSARVVATCVFAVTCLVTPVLGASDYFLKIEGIDGESKIERGAIDITAYSYDIKSPRDAASGQASGKRSATDGGATGDGEAEKVNMSDISFTCPLGKASPQLMQACATGKHFPKAILTCRKAGSKEPETFLKVTLEDCIVSSFTSTGDSSDVVPTECFSLNFEKITFRFLGGGDPSELVVKFVVKK